MVVGTVGIVASIVVVVVVIVVVGVVVGSFHKKLQEHDSMTQFTRYTDLHINVIPTRRKITRWGSCFIVGSSGGMTMGRGCFSPRCGGIPPTVCRGIPSSGEGVPVTEGGKKSPGSGGREYRMTGLHFPKLLVGGLSKYLMSKSELSERRSEWSKN